MQHLGWSCNRQRVGEQRLPADAQRRVNGGQCKGNYAKAKGGLGCQKLQNPRRGAKRGGLALACYTAPSSVPSRLCVEFSSQGGKHPGSPRLGQPECAVLSPPDKKTLPCVDWMRAGIVPGALAALAVLFCIICIVAARGIGAGRGGGTFQRTTWGSGHVSAININRRRGAKVPRAVLLTPL